jgi:signal transduction histidine kinase/DNA gyrase inhibitor GyrI
LLVPCAAAAAPYIRSGALPSEWSYSVEVKVSPAWDALVVPMRGSLAQHPEAVARLQRALEEHGITPVGPIFGRYLDDPSRTPEKDLRWEVGCQVTYFDGQVPGLEWRRFAAQLSASTRMQGPGGRQWRGFNEWLGSNGYQIIGGSIEFWHEGGTELWVPVRRLLVFPLVTWYAICIWGLILFGLFSFVYVRRDAFLGDRRTPTRLLSLRGGRLWGLFGLTCTVVYVQPLISDVIYLYKGERLVPLHVAAGAVALFIPAVVAHLFLRIAGPRLPWRRAFGAGVALFYLAAGAVGVEKRFGSALAALEGPQLVCALMLGAATLSLGMVLLAGRRGGLTGPSGERRTYLVLLCVAIAISVLQLTAQSEMRQVWDVALWALPIPFLLAATYFHERAVLFDVVAKRGVASLAALVALTAYFDFVTPWLWTSNQGWMGSWVFPLTALPIVLLAPLVNSWVTSRLDQYFLGRKLSPSEAHRFFLAGVGAATSERELLVVARERVAGIFPSQGRNAAHRREVGILLDPAEAGATTVRPPDSFEVSIVSRGALLGTMWIATPPGSRPFLSEDQRLFASLGEALGFALENLRLREKKLEQERRERELLLHASRAELKALRAQINPHFLFNALNSIAALIGQEPERAEVTVERLAEVFRYTLRRSDHEWVRLDEELAFVRCYLDLEATRFGRRLGVSVVTDPGVGEAVVPAMIIQTLVENAVKHGIAAVAGRGVVEVRAERASGRLRIQVRDNGPGFTAGTAAALATAGLGLRSVQDRLRGHFGGDAALVLERDEASGMTIAGVELPLLLVPPSEVRSIA